MNDTTVIGASSAPAEDVRDYVGAVRAWLGDLPPEEVDDLTAGMEADLAERAAETGERLGVLLGQPEEYAAELRAAAGLPPRGPGSPTPGSSEHWMARLEREGHELVARRPWLRELRASWWLLRGALLGWALSMVVGNGLALFPVAGAALSFWLTRRHQATRRGAGADTIPALVNVVALLVLVPAGASILDSSWASSSVEDPAPTSQGLALDGGPVMNLYVYDAAGNRVEGARIFDQDGRTAALDPSVLPLIAGPDGESVSLSTGDVRGSVFPVGSVVGEPWVSDSGMWAPPVSIPALPVAVTPTPGPTPSATPAPSTTPAPGAAPSPGSSTSPSPGASAPSSPSPSASAGAGATPSPSATP